LVMGWSPDDGEGWGGAENRYGMDRPLEAGSVRVGGKKVVRVGKGWG
jgi:hypothetical protein